MMDLFSFWSKFAPPAPLIADFSLGSSSWYKPLRLQLPSARIEQLKAADLLDCLEHQKPRRVDLALAPSGDFMLPSDLLLKNRVDAVHFSGNPALAFALAYHHFNFFTMEGEKLVQISRQNLPESAHILALHHRFTTPILTGCQHLDLPHLFQRYAIEPRGVIHVGAHEGEEADLYARMGFKRILFIEANPAVYARLVRRMNNRSGITCISCAVSNSNGLELLHVTTNDESSSLFPLKRHAELYPEIKEEAQIVVGARRIDHLLREIGHNPADYNFLHLDIQGAELKALQGAVETLPGIDAISTEVNYEELYEGCPLVEDLDDFLEPFAFERLFTATPAHPQWGDAFYLREPTVTFRNLGQWGRFGNQVFEYAFLKIFAKRHRLHVRTCPWPGNVLFGANDPLADPARQFPQYLESTYALKDSQIANAPFRPVNLDLCGVFQYHSAYFAPDKDYFRSVLQPVPALKQILDSSLDRARGGAKTLVALHLRRGDYGFGLFFIPPNSWYLNWLRDLWPTLDSPVLYIATDEPDKVLSDFAQYHPISSAGLKLPSLGADYYPDFYVLSQADHVAISNSSYSFSASMLNDRGRTFLRPDLFAGRLVPFDPWNSEPLLHRELGILDYRVVAKVVSDFLQRPSEPQLANFLRNARAQLAQSFAQIKGEQLQLVLSMDLWACYTDIRKANLRSLPLVDAEKQIVTTIQARISQMQGTDAIGPYIAATLFLHPTNLPRVDLSPLPTIVKELLQA